MNALSLPQLPCMCANFRRATRAITQLYEEELRPAKLRGTQFTLLQALWLAGEVTQGELGRILAMDSTTLTRTLAVMHRRGWIAQRHGTDRREWRLGLSKAGKAQFKRAFPYWERAQARLRKQLGDSQWNELMKLTDLVTNAITKQGGTS